LWHIEEGRTFFAGPLFFNTWHEHGAPVFLAGLYGGFGLRVGGGAWQSCRTAVIPAGVSHQLDVGGEPIAVLYIEPDLDGASALTSLVKHHREVDGSLIGSSGEVGLLRALYEDRESPSRLGPALVDLLGFATRRAVRQMDPRVARAVATIAGGSAEAGSVQRVAESVGLSASRFQHLFTREVGVPFRRYRAWQRMRVAIRAIVDGTTFTRAAHVAGFADQAHFAHDFRRTFGAPASVSLSRVRPHPGRATGAGESVRHHR
jgi:AraC-like DNA-binding protein